MHLTEETIQRLVDGELPDGVAGAAAHHLESCPGCAASLQRARDEMAGIVLGVALLDHPVPVVDPRRIVERVDASRISRIRLAASVALFLGAATVAAALPGSPVRAWLGLIPKSGPVSPVAPTPLPEGPPAAGIAVAPGQNLTIVLEVPPGGVTAAIELVEGGDVAVSTAVTGTTFTSAVDTLRIGRLVAGTVVRIAVPRGAPRVVLWTGSAAPWSKEGGRVNSPAEADSLGVYRLTIRP